MVDAHHSIFIQVALERTRRILGIELEGGCRRRSSRKSPDADEYPKMPSRERMIQARKRGLGEDHRHVDLLVELIQMLDAQRDRERGNHPDPQRQENADDSKTALDGNVLLGGPDAEH